MLGTNEGKSYKAVLFQIVDNDDCMPMQEGFLSMVLHMKFKKIIVHPDL